MIAGLVTPPRLTLQQRPVPESLSETTFEEVMHMTRVIWKEEIEGYGPAFVYAQDDEVGKARPFDPDRKPPPWVSRTEAEAVAAEHNVQLETT